MPAQGNIKLIGANKVVAGAIIASLIQLGLACANGETQAINRCVAYMIALRGCTGRKCEAVLNENRSIGKDGLLALQ